METVISIHAPAKGATLIVLPIALEPLNFNPRSREGSDTFTQLAGYGKFDISIHAPAKGATSSLTTNLIVSTISIHAPAKGATQIVSNDVDQEVISIHAPAKGATTIHLCGVYVLVISIHAPAKGVTVAGSPQTLISSFQSTLPRRERPDQLHHYQT